MIRFELLAVVFLAASTLFAHGCASSSSGRGTGAGADIYEPHAVEKGEVVYVREVDMPIDERTASVSRGGGSRNAMTRSRMDVMGMRVDARRGRPLRRETEIGASPVSEPAAATIPGVEISVELENGSVVVVMQPLGDETFEIGDFVRVLLRDDGGAMVIQ